MNAVIYWATQQFMRDYNIGKSLGIPDTGEEEKKHRKVPLKLHNFSVQRQSLMISSLRYRARYNQDVFPFYVN